MTRWLLWPLSKTKDTEIVVMASQTALCDVNDLRNQMFWIKKGDVDSGQLPPCKFKVPLYFMLCGPIIKKCVWKIYFEPKRIPTARRDTDG